MWGQPQDEVSWQAQHTLPRKLFREITGLQKIIDKLNSFCCCLFTQVLFQASEAPRWNDWTIPNMRKEDMMSTSPHNRKWVSEEDRLTCLSLDHSVQRWSELSAGSRPTNSTHCCSSLSAMRWYWEVCQAEGKVPLMSAQVGTGSRQQCRSGWGPHGHGY